MEVESAKSKVEREEWSVPYLLQLCDVPSPLSTCDFPLFTFYFPLCSVIPHPKRPVRCRHLPPLLAGAVEFDDLAGVHAADERVAVAQAHRRGGAADVALPVHLAGGVELDHLVAAVEGHEKAAARQDL